MNNPPPLQESPSSRAEQMLLEFLRDHDADCPVCGYNLRGLTTSICPECRQKLVLTVGASRLRLGWLFVAVAPGFFSGIAACFVLVPILGRVLLGDGVWSLFPIAVALFGFTSGVLAIVLAVKRTRFLSQVRAVQVSIALAIWFIHVAALAACIVLISVYL